jgi:transposase
VLTLPSAVRIYVAAEPVDLRRGFDGLAAATRSVIREEPESGHLFVFLNRRRERTTFRIPFEHGRYRVSVASAAWAARATLPPHRSSRE